MTIRGILFDKDGTLLDFHATWAPIYRAAARMVAHDDAVLTAELLAAGGQDDGLETVRAGSLLAVGSTGEIAAAWAKLAPDHGFADLTGALDEIFLRIGGAVPVPDLAGIVGRLRARGLALGVATSDSRAGALASLGPFGLLANFAFVAGYDSGFGIKPGPGMVLGFCDAVGLRPAEVLVTGDNRHDLAMGRRAGAGLCVGVLSGTSARDHLFDLADHVVDGIADIEALLPPAAGHGEAERPG